MPHNNFLNQVSKTTTTVDATPVVLETQAPAPNTSVVVEYTIIGRGVTSGSMNVYIIRHAFRVDGAGNVTETFPQDKVWVKEEDAAWDANLSIVGGTTMQCAVTGDAAESVRWSGVCRALLQLVS